MITLLPTVLLTLLPPGPAGAAPVFPGAELPPLVVGEHTFHRRLLANGLRAVAVQDADERVSVFVVLGVGARQETAATTGLAHLVEHAMFSGTPTTGTDEHEHTVKGWGGESNAFTREDYTLYYDHLVPAAELERVLAMEADRLRNLSFEEGPVLHERGRLEREEANTHRASDDRVQQLEGRVYRVHPYRFGVRDAEGHTMAPSLDVEAIRGFYDRHYHPRNVCVVVVGALEPSAMLDAVEAAFAGLPQGPAAPPPPREPWLAEGREERIPSELPQDRVELVWLVPGVGDSSRPALKLLAHWLGRAQLEDGTPVETWLEDRVDRTLFRLAAGGEGAREQLVAIVERARAEAPGADELAIVADVARQEFSAQPLRARPYFSLAAIFGVHEVHGRAHVLAERAGEVDLLGPEDVRAAALRWLDPARCVTVVFEGTGAEVAPLPDDPGELQRAAMDAADGGDHRRAIAAYTRLLAGKPDRMNTVIFLATRGQIHMELRDYDAAIADFEQALAVVDYPAVRELLREADARKKAALRGEFEPREPGQPGGDDGGRR